jgi:hypothetical protein
MFRKRKRKPEQKGVSKMAEPKENPKCDNCGSSEHPVSIYNPNTPGHPTKRKLMCDKCATEAVPKPTFIELLTAPISVPENVPDIAPAVPEPQSDTDTKEFGPKLQELNVVPPEPTTPVQDLGPVPPDAIRQKITAQEKDIDALMGQEQKLQGQLAQLRNIIMAKRGAVAQLRELLGNAAS